MIERFLDYEMYVCVCVYLINVNCILILVFKSFDICENLEIIYREYFF